MDLREYYRTLLSVGNAHGVLLACLSNALDADITDSEKVERITIITETALEIAAKPLF